MNIDFCLIFDADFDLHTEVIIGAENLCVTLLTAEKLTRENFTATFTAAAGGFESQPHLARR